MNNMEYSKMSKIQMKALVRHVLTEFGSKTEKVCVEINGQLAYYTEREIRALQIIAKRAALESDEAFEEFCKSVTVYQGRCKGHPRKRGYDVMKFRKSGKFSTEFKPGFFDTNANLAFEVF